MLALAEALLDEVLAAALLALLAAELLDAALLLSAPVLALLLAPALDELPLPPQAVSPRQRANRQAQAIMKCFFMGHSSPIGSAVSHYTYQETVRPWLSATLVAIR